MTGQEARTSHWPVAPFADMKRRAVEAAEVERLAMGIAVIAGPRVRIAADEVARRARVFADAQASSTAETSLSPRVAALSSVLDDLTAGRLA